MTTSERPSRTGQRGIERFEDIVAWQKARELTAAVYSVTSSGSLRRDFSLRDQIQRSATSTMANIAEGFERGSRAEFHRFLTIAKGSCAELRSHLYVARDAGHLTDEGFRTLLEQATEVARVLGGLRASVAPPDSKARP